MNQSVVRVSMIPHGEKTRFALVDADEAQYDTMWNAPYNLVTRDVARTKIDECIAKAVAAGADPDACAVASRAWFDSWFGT